MKRKFCAALLSALLLVGALTACGAEDSGSKTTESNQTSGASDETTAQEETGGGDVSQDDKEAEFDMSAVSGERSVTVDKAKAITGENTLYEGMGFISANNSSRLLLDYKSENPEAYWEILNYVFGNDGLGVSLYKLEMGADVNSSSGTEPSVKRSEEEGADVTRGAGYQLAADALTVNPDLKIDMLYWGMPGWVGAYKENEEKYTALYKWYKETIDTMYDTYGIKVSYITAGQNERAVDPEFIKYISGALENETDERYDYGSIKIVAGEGVCDWRISGKMLTDEELMEAVDVVTSHYTSFTDDDTKKLQAEMDKKVWFSEGSSPMKAEMLARNREESGSGIGGLNGMLDIASRITQAMAEGMTMYEFQPLISAYYDGATYFPKQLITANEPWSGAYSLDAGYYMTLHFSRFIKPGWQFIKDACYGDGVAGGDGHAIVDSTFNYITCTDPDTDDYSTVIVNNSDKTLKYEINVKGFKKAGEKMFFWETVDEYDGSGSYYDSFFNKLGSVTPEEKDDGSYAYTVVIKPYSMATVSTLDIEDKEYKDRSSEHEMLKLDYEDDFEYKDRDADFLSKRGMAPLYTTDQSGAFEVEKTGDGNVLMQKINFENKGKEWGSSPEPVTTLGADVWHNYTVSVDAHFTDSPVQTDKENYVGVGARYILSSSSYSGYSLRLTENGTCILMKDKTELEQKSLESFDAGAWHKLAVTVKDDTVTAFVDGEQVIEYTEQESAVNSGRVSLCSSYQNNYFDNLKITSDEENYWITRIDDMAPELEYSKGSTDEKGEGWYFNTMSSFSNYNRTASRGRANDTVSFEFEGKDLALLGKNSEAVLKVEIDGNVVSEAYECKASKERSAAYAAFGLENKKHTVKITVVSGEFWFDAVEYR